MKSAPEVREPLYNNNPTPFLLWTLWVIWLPFHISPMIGLFQSHPSPLRLIISLAGWRTLL